MALLAGLVSCFVIKGFTCQNALLCSEPLDQLLFWSDDRQTANFFAFFEQSSSVVLCTLLASFQYSYIFMSCLAINNDNKNKLFGKSHSCEDCNNAWNNMTSHHTECNLEIGFSPTNGLIVSSCDMAQFGYTFSHKML